MLVAAIIAWVMLAAAVLVQMAGAVLFARRLSAATTVTVENAAWPKVGVVISLRGADATLPEGLRSLLDQDYPDYLVRVIVDSRHDPAWRVASDAVAAGAAGRATVAPLESRPGTCSLKCAAILQAIHALDDDVEVVAFADADTLPHATWLRELVAPLRDPAVGAAYGNRWFWPDQGTTGSMIRALWNAAAVVPMYLCGMPWGGTFAISMKALREARLTEIWARSMVEDAPTRDALQAHGLKLRFVPSLMMINRESCTLSECVPFLVRQLLWTRLYHSGWGVVLTHTLTSSVLQLAAVWLVVRGFLAGDLAASVVAASGLALYHGGNVLMLAIIESAMCVVAERRGEPCDHTSLCSSRMIVPAIIATQAVHLWAVALASFSQAITWRGISYAIHGAFDITMEPYQPITEPMTHHRGPFKPRGPHREPAGADAWIANGQSGCASVASDSIGGNVFVSTGQETQM